MGFPRPASAAVSQPCHTFRQHFIVGPRCAYQTERCLLFSPISGTITAVNEALTANPALLNTDPYGEGWIFKITVEAGEEIEKLKSPAQYREQIGGGDPGAEV